MFIRLVVGVAFACACNRAPAPAPDGPLDPAKYAAYFTQYPFGGHDLEWWATRLEELGPKGAHADAKLYALTVDRAHKNGLVVEDQGPHLVVKPKPELAAVLMKRLEVK